MEEKDTLKGEVKAPKKLLRIPSHDKIRELKEKELFKQLEERILHDSSDWNWSPESDFSYGPYYKNQDESISKSNNANSSGSGNYVIFILLMIIKSAVSSYVGASGLGFFLVGLFLLFDEYPSFGLLLIVLSIFPLFIGYKVAKEDFEKNSTNYQ